MKTPELIFRFLVVGTMNFLITAVVIWFMTEILKQDYLVGNVVSYVVAQTNNFLWCKYWIFPVTDDRKRSLVQQLVLFLTAFACAYLAQVLFIMLLIEVFSMNVYLAQFLGLFVYGAINFTMNRMLTFR